MLRRRIGGRPPGSSGAPGGPPPRGAPPRSMALPRFRRSPRRPGKGSHAHPPPAAILPAAVRPADALVAVSADRTGGAGGGRPAGRRDRRRMPWSRTGAFSKRVGHRVGLDRRSCVRSPRETAAPAWSHCRGVAVLCLARRGTGGTGIVRVAPAGAPFCRGVVAAPKAEGHRSCRPTAWGRPFCAIPPIRDTRASWPAARAGAISTSRRAGTPSSAACWRTPSPSDAPPPGGRPRAPRCRPGRRPCRGTGSARRATAPRHRLAASIPA